MSMELGNSGMDSEGRERKRKERERERERERELYWQSNRWLKVGKYNASSGWHREREVLLTPGLPT
jgi:hypothetical protein